MRIDSQNTKNFGDWEVYIDGELFKGNIILVDTEQGMVKVVTVLVDDVIFETKTYKGRVELVNKKTGIVIRSQKH